MAAITLSYNPLTGAGDIDFIGGRIATGDPLHTLVYTSLFCDAYADASRLPAPADERRGYWGDAFEADGQSHGSHLWLLNPEKITPDVIKRARDDAQAALNWMVDQGKCRAVLVTAERFNLQTIGLRILITRNDGTQTTVTVTL